MSDQSEIKTIGIIGGTGREGKGLAYRWLKAGYHVIIGSRQAEKAEAAAEEIRSLVGENCPGVVSGMANPNAAARADLVVLTVPYAAHRSTLESLKDCLAGKILVDVTVPLVPPKVTRVQMPPEGSAAQAAQAILGDQVRVVGAFQNVSYERLLNDNEDVGCDVLVTGSGKAAREQVLELVRAAGMTGWDAGPIENSVVAEGLTSVLIGINKQFGVQSAGIKITGVPRDPLK
ncbi:MAG: NADPH-dependent F420 reductase [Chloroflexi bacterium]|nr:NADPH-dependent F420 reductase [Chloroflexota bacterium]